MDTHPYLAQGETIAFAHRGGARETSENTIEAFRYATELGFRYLETDAQLTRDGVPIAFHDPDLDRVSDTDAEIGDVSLEELAEVRLDEGGRIASIEEVLETFPEARFNIDAKSDAVLDPLIEVISRVGAWDRVCIASFFDHRIRRVRRRVGDRAFTAAGPLEISTMFASGFLGRSSRSSAAAVQVPTSVGPVPVVTRRFVEIAHAAGNPVHVWTIDEPELMHELLDLGVDGIMTDRPTVLRDVFTERGLW